MTVTHAPVEGLRDGPGNREEQRLQSRQHQKLGAGVLYVSIYPSIYIYVCIHVYVYMCISGHTSTGAQVLVLWLGLGCGHLHPVHQRGKPRSELKLPGTVQFGLGLGLGLGLVGVAWNQ